MRMACRTCSIAKRFALYTSEGTPMRAMTSTIHVIAWYVKDVQLHVILEPKRGVRLATGTSGVSDRDRGRGLRRYGLLPPAAPWDMIPDGVVQTLSTGSTAEHVAISKAGDMSYGLKVSLSYIDSHQQDSWLPRDPVLRYWASPSSPHKYVVDG